MSGVEPNVAPGEHPRVFRLLLGIVAAAIVIGRLPGPLGGWVQAVGTAAHESGHALVADVLTGDVLSITVFRDGGGVALSEASASGWRSFLVAAAGYPATLFAGLGLLTAVLLARSSRQVAAAGAGVALIALVLWTPFSSRVPVVDDGDQRFTFFVLLLLALVLAGAAALPARFDTARRVVLGAVAVGLLADAFRAGSDLVTIEGEFGETTTDADALAEASGFLSATAWAWGLRLALFALAAAWAWLLVRRMAPKAADATA